jgi:fluoroquinolone resistance protein
MEYSGAAFRDSFVRSGPSHPAHLSSNELHQSERFGMTTIDTLARQIAAAEPVQALRLSDDHWPELDCAGARFTDCTFERVQFSNAMLEEAQFSNCRFIACRFSHAELASARFADCRFTDDGAKGCSFAFSNLQRAEFSGCDLSQTVFDRTDMFAVEMRDCNLTGARFATADFSRALSRKTIETRAIFQDCKLDVADLSGVKLPGCSLNGCRLREADLSNADLTDADLTGSDLFQAILDGAKMAGVDLRGAEVSGVNLTRAADFVGVKVSDDQMFRLLEAMGVEVRVPEK